VVLRSLVGTLAIAACGMTFVNSSDHGLTLTPVSHLYVWVLALLDRQLLAGLGPPPLKDVAAALGAHSGAETVDALTTSLLGLPSTLGHDCSSLVY
jgi:hypothetical protein